MAADHELVRCAWCGLKLPPAIIPHVDHGQTFCEPLCAQKAEAMAEQDRYDRGATWPEDPEDDVIEDGAEPDLFEGEGFAC